MSSNQSSYRPDIDGLRAIAVLSVVFCHAGFSFSGGYVGVDVFFVISGYLIAGLILKELKQGTFTLGNFWERRVRRIAPAMLVVTAFTLVAGWFILMPADYAGYGKSLVGLMLLASNIQFKLSTNYFESSAEEKPLLHTWSLSVEEQFYLFVPVFLLLLARKQFLNRAFLILSVAAILSFVLSVDGAYRHPTATFYLLPTRAWELFAGALLAFAQPSPAPAKTWRHECLAVLGMALILVPCFVYTTKTPFPGLAALPPVLGAVLLIWTGTFSVQLPIMSQMLASRPMVFIGLISYSLYLWHWPLFSFTRYQAIKEIPTQVWLALIAASFALAILSWRFVETPFRKRQFLVARPRLFAATAAAFVVLLGSGAVLYQTNGFAKRLTERTERLAATGKFDARYVREQDAASIPNGLTRLGQTNAEAKLLVWGDSHAMAILPAIDELCRETGTAAVAATHAATPPVLDYFSRNEWGLNERSIPFNAAVMDYIRTGKIKTVFLVSCWKMHGESPEFQAALSKTIDLLLAAKVSVFLMKEVPTYTFNVNKTLVRLSYKGADTAQLGLSVAEYEAAEKLPPALLQQFKARGVTVIEPVPFLQARSKSDKFLPYDDGGSFYYDYFHLSTYGALALKPLLAPVIQSVGGVAGLSAH